LVWVPPKEIFVRSVDAMTRARDGSPIIITIPGEAVAFARSGANGVQRFTPKRQRDFMALVKLAAYQAMRGAEPLAGAVEMQIRAVYTIPASWSKKRDGEARWRTARPDVDNIAKLAADSMNGIVYGDDAQVASLTAQKVYGLRAEVIITVACLDGNSEGD